MTKNDLNPHYDVRESIAHHIGKTGEYIEIPSRQSYQHAQGRFWRYARNLFIGLVFFLILGAVSWVVGTKVYQMVHSPKPQVEAVSRTHSVSVENAVKDETKEQPQVKKKESVVEKKPQVEIVKKERPSNSQAISTEQPKWQPSNTVPVPITEEPVLEVPTTVTDEPVLEVPVYQPPVEPTVEEVVSSESVVESSMEESLPPVMDESVVNVPPKEMESGIYPPVESFSMSEE